VIRGLYAVTPECRDTDQLKEKVADAIIGGANIVQYRSKSKDRALKIEQARALHEICRKRNIPFIVNDDIDLALEIDAEGVHIGQDDGPIMEARARLGNKLLGVSCYDRLDLATEAAALGADYVAFGSFFASNTKPDAASAQLPLLQMSKLSIKIPVVAIGGITPGNGAVLVESGADALAVVTALFDAADIQVAARQFSELFSAKK
jgi:thiamine-phosphate pyrophosphorylase